MNPEIHLTVLMPCLNEVRTVGICIDKIHQACARLGLRYEIVVSDNGSHDGSAELALRNGARVIHADRPGYGAALQAGFEASRGQYILFADADDTYDFQEIEKFWQQVQSGAKVVIGTRLAGHIRSGAMPHLHRYLGTPVLTWLIRNLFALPISDCNSGMRLIEKDLYQTLNLRSEGMEFASEMLIKIGLNRSRICEIPITLSAPQMNRQSHVRTWSDGWRHLCIVFKYAFYR